MAAFPITSRQFLTHNTALGFTYCITSICFGVRGSKKHRCTVLAYMKLLAETNNGMFSFQAPFLPFVPLRRAFPMFGRRNIWPSTASKFLIRMFSHPVDMIAFALVASVKFCKRLFRLTHFQYLEVLVETGPPGKANPLGETDMRWQKLSIGQAYS